MFDIVVPVGPNDVGRIHRQLAQSRKNIVGYRNVYVITPSSEYQFNDVITIDENIFPFTMQNVAAIHGKQERNGWYLQQLLKLYAGRVIPGILDKYLVIDADTFFLRPVEFEMGGRNAYGVGHEPYHSPYFEHMVKLHPTLERMSPAWSGICHHMFFDNKHIDALFALVEGETAKSTWKPFWQLFLEKVDPEHISGAGASEYEIYFNYVIKYHPNEIFIRPLDWRNCSPKVLEHYLETELTDLDYLSCHYYLKD